MSKRQKEIKKAQSLVKQLGIRSAAGYLRNRGWSVEAALYLLC
jgi:hypothetical protein